MDCKEVIQQVFSRSLSGLKEDPALSQRVIELSKNEKGKQKPACRLIALIRKGK